MHADRPHHCLLSVEFGRAGAGADRGVNGGTATEANELTGRREFAILRAQSFGFQFQHGRCVGGELAGGGGGEQVGESAAGARQDLIHRAFEQSAQRADGGWTKLAARHTRSATEQGAKKPIQLLFVVCAEQFSGELLFFGFTKR
jgi:hypothetical protein